MEDYKALEGSKIEIPYDSFEVISCGEHVNTIFAKWTFVSYVDTMECSICHMSNISQWKRIQHLFEDAGETLNVTLVYCPQKQIIEGMKRNYRQSGGVLDIYLDTMRCFMRYNPHIPKNSKMHTMLLDSTGNVVLIGNPTRNSKIEELLMEYVNSIKKQKHVSSGKEKSLKSW